MTIYTTVQEI